MNKNPTKKYRVSEPEYYNLHDLKNYVDKNRASFTAEHGELIVNEINKLCRVAYDVGALVTGMQLVRIRCYKNMMLEIRLKNAKTATAG